MLDAQTLGYADFRGNLQYISMGNLAGNDRAALILMDYANRQRLKIFARIDLQKSFVPFLHWKMWYKTFLGNYIEVLERQANPELIARLEDPTYRGRVERAMVLHIEAFDWKCQQHITRRYTTAEIQTMMLPLHEQIARLEAAVTRLKSSDQ